MLGADVTRSGWAVVRWDGETATVRHHRDFASVWEAGLGATVIGVDIPIGLTDGPDREADGLARRELGRRGVCVFSTPCRPAVLEPDYARANALSRQLAGKGISKQAHHLRKRLLEVDGHVGDRRLFEVHPEVSFAQRTGAPMRWPKRTWEGVRQRMATLGEAGLVPVAEDEAAARLPVDDVLDAAIVAWTAMRIARGEARSIPADPTQHDRGHPLAIWV